MVHSIDTRELAERLEELRDIGDLETGRPLTQEESQEVEQIRLLEDSLEGFDDGVTMIPESDFEEYAEELAEETGAIDVTAAWPLGAIDWEQAANELRQDYTHVVFDGVDYLARP